VIDERPHPDVPLLRFGSFELDADSAELLRHGERIALPPQPFKVLSLLVRSGGSVVTRDEIRTQVWGAGTHVEFDQGLNFCIRQIREALGDDANSPRYIETLPRRGYRFLTPVASAAPEKPQQLTRIIVLPFRLLRDDPDTAYLAFSLPDAVTSCLSGLESVVVRSSLVAARYAGAAADTHAIGKETNVDLIVTGTLLRSSADVRVHAQLTEAESGTLVWSHTAQAPVGDLFQLQDELARRIVDSLAVPLSARDQQRLGTDVPASKAAYDFFLRGNQLSVDPKQWAVARDLYERSVAGDPRFAPAWARLGRMYHVQTKYIEGAHDGGLTRAEQAFKRSLELNPELSIAHKLYANLEADLGRARDAMVRLLGRARTADPEVMAGLVTACRYCGLLDASVAAHERARALDPKISTSVMHTWFMQGDYKRVASGSIVEYPYIVPAALTALGRGDEALPTLRDLEGKMPTRRRHMLIAARALLEGRAQDSVTAVLAMLSPDFRDPEGRFYIARHVARHGDADQAITQLEGVVADGFFCYPAFEGDSSFDSLRNEPRFVSLLEQCEREHRAALAAFTKFAG
jgi:DNA-binding winged helix-turn-helix (wHTH) protein/tetratricopeptide (TPR) repeat protein